MALPRRDAPPTRTMNPNDVWDDHEFKGDYPNIFAFIHDASYSDGSTRLTGSLTLFCKMGCLTIAVNDNDRKLVAYVSARSVAEAYTLVDEGICNDSLEWRARSPFQGGQKPPY